jgi:type I restriction-modification system DNA methylase subunit
MSKLIKAIENQSIYSKNKSNKFGEVFTPTELIIEMLSSLPKKLWKDPTKTFFDPCSGFGNFPAVVITKLMSTLKKQIPDTEMRYKHIIENMIYMAEYQKESAIFINDLFSMDGEYKINLYVGDTLTMPDDFFDLNYEERKIKYTDNVIC